MKTRIPHKSLNAIFKEPYSVDVGKGLVFKNGKEVKSFQGSYYYIYVNGKKFRRCDVIFYFHHAYLPIIVDHKNRIKTDDRIENLRASDHSLNRVKTISEKNRFGIVGICQFKVDKYTYWKASFAYQGARFQKLFKTKGEAIKQRREWEREYLPLEYQD